MKNNVMHLFAFTAILLLANSFVKQPVPSEALSTDQELKASVPFGGAWVIFAGKTGGELTKQDINNQTELQVDGCDKGARVSGFTLLFTKSGKTSTLNSRSNTLTYEMRNILKSLAKGDQFEFKNTKALLSNGRDVVDVRGSKFVVV
ncbi:MAG: hypothetical protein H7246_02230 [Phycisphaerae bacterium]|nr:hypothetical protein [Saprospiraceae bacterium]